MKKSSKILAIVIALLVAMTMTLVGCGDDSGNNNGGNTNTAVKLNEWSAPSYNDATVGQTVFVQAAQATDTNGNLYRATYKVIGPDGLVAVSDDMFVVAKAGNYNVVYVISAGGQEYQKVAAFTATAGGNGGNSQQGGNGGGSQQGGQTASGVLGALKVWAGSEDYFSVSGNTVTVKKTVSTGDYKSIGWELTGWTLANGEKIKIKVTNNTAGTLNVKVKTNADGKDGYYGYPDLSIAAGGSDTYEQFTGGYDHQAPSSVESIEMFIGGSAGSFTVEAILSGSGSSSGSGSGNSGTTDPVLGVLDCLPNSGAEEYFSVFGNTVTVKKTCTTGDWKCIGWQPSGWTLANGENIRIVVKNNTNGTLTMKYKVKADGSELYGHPDLSIAPGETGVYSQYTGTLNNTAPSSVTEIGLAFGCTVASGTFTVEAELIGQGGSASAGTTTLGALTVPEWCEEYFTASGNTVTVKKAVAESDYKGFTYTVSNWDKTKASNLIVSYTNTSGASLKLKAKVMTDKGASYSYGEPTVAAGANGTFTFNILQDNPSATAIESIEVFVIAEGACTFTVTLSFS